jgi:hypothetical protein
MFDHLAHRALGIPLANAAAPRIRTSYDEVGLATTESFQAIREERGTRVGPVSREAPVARESPVPLLGSAVSRDPAIVPRAAVARDLPLEPERAQTVVEHDRTIVERSEVREQVAAAAPPPRERLEAPAAPTARAAPAPASALAQPSARALAPPGLPPQRDTIRVHIGRVDVRAVFPATPAPAPRATERPQPAVTLDKFLSRDRGRER